MPRRQRTSSQSADAAGARLPDAELEVMACLWQRGQATARQIREAMASYRPMAHGSVLSLLGRLAAKGWVTREKGSWGKAFVYRATRCPGPTYRRILRELVRRVFGENGVAMTSTLFDTKPPTQKELAQLQQLLDELRAKADKRGKRR